MTNNNIYDTIIIMDNKQKSKPQEDKTMTVMEMIKELRATAENYDKAVQKHISETNDFSDPNAWYAKGKADGLRLAADKLITLL